MQHPSVSQRLGNGPQAARFQKFKPSYLVKIQAPLGRLHGGHFQQEFVEHGEA